jgi:hypothetical protein
MFDQMGMPVLFAVLISTLALVSIGVFIAVRVLAARPGPAKAVAAPTDGPATAAAAVETAKPTRRPELD